MSSPAVSLVDIFPTIIDVVGEKDNYSEGRSLLTLIDNKELTDYSGANFVQVYEGKIIAVRKG